MSTHKIARRVGIARSTVRETLKRAETASLAWPLPESTSDAVLEAGLYAHPRSKRGHQPWVSPDRGSQAPVGPA